MKSFDSPNKFEASNEWNHGALSFHLDEKRLF